MSKRQELLDVIDGRLADRPLFAPLADAMYAASIAGKAWLTEATYDDQVEAARVGGYHPLFLQYLPLNLQLHPALELDVTLVDPQPEQRVWQQALHTPRGTVSRRVVEQPRRGVTALGEFIISSEQFPIVHWIAEDILAGRRDNMIRSRASAFIKALRPHGVTEVHLRAFCETLSLFSTPAGTLRRAAVLSPHG